MRRWWRALAGLDQEIGDHLELDTQENIARGHVAGRSSLGRPA